MATYAKATKRTGLRPPGGDARTSPDDIHELLELTNDDDPKVRRLATKNLCPCHVRADVPQVWDRLFDMLDDPDPGVRRDAVHALGDGSPRERAAEIASALEPLYNDPDRTVRKHVRRVVTAYRRTGRVNVL
jgi:HEAT repeat protein